MVDDCEQRSNVYARLWSLRRVMSFTEGRYCVRVVPMYRETGVWLYGPTVVYRTVVRSSILFDGGRVEGMSTDQGMSCCPV